MWKTTNASTGEKAESSPRAIDKQRNNRTLLEKTKLEKNKARKNKARKKHYSKKQSSKRTLLEKNMA